MFYLYNYYFSRFLIFRNSVLWLFHLIRLFTKDNLDSFGTTRSTTILLPIILDSSIFNASKNLLSFLHDYKMIKRRHKGIGYNYGKDIQLA